MPSKNYLNKRLGYLAITLALFFSSVVILIQKPIAQNLNYHLFVDQNTIFGIPNFWNVISNLPFLLLGITGLYSILYSHKMNLINDIKVAYLLFFLGVSLVAIGSGYYHLWPSNQTLVWDRLPMTIAFMALFSIIIAEFISLSLAKIIFFPLISFGIFTVFYWYITESNGESDLRPYILVQFIPMITIPIIRDWSKTALLLYK